MTSPKPPTVASDARAPATDGWVVYLLRLSDGTLYCGCTNNLARRLGMHASGAGSRIVRAKRPFTLAYVERIPDGGRAAAQRREAGIKKLRKDQKERLCSSPFWTSERRLDEGS